MNRVKTGLGLLAAGAALALTVGAPASAAPAPAKPSGTAVNTPAAKPVPASVVQTGGVSPAARTARTSGFAITAADRDARCNVFDNGDGDFCLWFLQDFGGSYIDLFFTDTNLCNGDVFLTAGAGQGAPVCANAEGDLNADSNFGAEVCTDINRQGTCGVVPPRGLGNFVAPWRNGVRSFALV
jgi:hypothetical protein